MKLDQDVRRMATELQDSLLLARISSGDLMATEAKYHFNCLSAFRNKYWSTQRAQKSSSNSQEEEVIQVQVFAGLTLYTEESIESGNYIFKLSELHSVYVSQNLELKSLFIKRDSNCSCLIIFWEIARSSYLMVRVLLVFNQGMKYILKEAVDSCDLESETRAMMKCEGS